MIFFIDNYKLQVCDNINYVGLIYTYSGSFNSCFKYLSDKASRPLFTILSSMRELPVNNNKLYIVMDCTGRQLKCKPL